MKNLRLKSVFTGAAIIACMVIGIGASSLGYSEEGDPQPQVQIAPEYATTDDEICMIITIPAEPIDQEIIVCLPEAALNSGNNGA